MFKRIMGIDPSMRSTGICVWDIDNNKHMYNLICSTTTKKVKSFKNQRFKLYMYDAISVKDKNSIGKESAKTINIYNIVQHISNLLDYYKPDLVNIEAIAMSANGRVDELSGLNYAIRILCIEKDILCCAISPSANKMEFSGNGQATKDMMVHEWSVCDPDSKIFINTIGKHVEDIADAYALCHYPSETYLNSI